MPDEFAAAVHEQAVQTLADAGMTRDAVPGAPQSPQADPWDNSWPSSQGGPPSQPQTSTVPPPPPPVPSGTVTINTPKGAQQWTTGAANAPLCECNDPAAYVQGYTNGKLWKRWACAKGAGENWRGKCNFSVWA